MTAQAIVGFVVIKPSALRSSHCLLPPCAWSSSTSAACISGSAG